MARHAPEAARRLRWGLLREYEVYEDTERTRELDEYLGAGEPRP